MLLHIYFIVLNKPSLIWENSKKSSDGSNGSETEPNRTEPGGFGPVRFSNLKPKKVRVPNLDEPAFLDVRKANLGPDRLSRNRPEDVPRLRERPKPAVVRQMTI